MHNFTLNKEEESKIEIYQKMLLNYQNQTNLISANTINNMWERHIVDSAQLYPIIQELSNKEDILNIADIGTGAGFPGLILAILDNKNKYFLIDSNGKKTKFLEEVTKELKINNVTVLNQRIEEVTTDVEFTIIVSRALCKLEKLYLLAKKLLKNDGIGLFFKGKTYQEEVNNLLIKHNQLKNKITLIQSITNKESKIIQIVFDKNSIIS